MSNGDGANAKSRRRLRVPATLAVAFAGTSATVAMTFAGCSPTPPPEPIDAGEMESMRIDAGVDIDAAEPEDAAQPIADAAMLPPDAPHT